MVFLQRVIFLTFFLREQKERKELFPHAFKITATH